MIRKLMSCQTHDPGRGSFFVKIEATRDRYNGQRVYVANAGTPAEQRFVLVD